MNRRSFTFGALFATVAGVAYLPGRALAGAAFPPSLHPSIQANIDYWMKAAPDWLAECPPVHTSYYAVKEGERLRVYAVKWNGSNLNDHSLSIPRNESALIFEYQEAVDKASSASQNMDIGQTVIMSDGQPMQFCSYVFDSPLRRIKKWGGSLSTSLLARERFLKLRVEDIGL